MSTARIWQTESTSLDATLKLAATVGSRLRGGEIIELISDLGGGKTSFVRGLAKGMGSNDEVRSPSFTLINQYEAGDKRMYHFDFYRLSEPGIMTQELSEAQSDSSAVVVVEWPQIMADVLPASRLTIKLTATGENSRQLEFIYTDDILYLIPGDSGLK